MNSQKNFAPIAALDLDPIKLKLMHKESGEGWSLDYADAVEFEYRRFLYLVKKFPHEQAAPLVDVDVFWHYHILDTMKYAADCEQIFGYFLHHHPYRGLGGEVDEAEHNRTGARMQELYEATFGEAYIRQEAWCEGIKGKPASPQSASTKTAWCEVIMGKPASPQSASAKTAFCDGMIGKPASPLSASAKTAWCDGTIGKPAQLASAKTAWCDGIMGKPASPLSAPSKTAWCQPAIR